MGTLLAIATGGCPAVRFDETLNVKFRASTSGCPLALDDQLPTFARIASCGMNGVTSLKFHHSD